MTSQPNSPETPPLIPTEITLGQYVRACKAFCAELGIDPMRVYSDTLVLDSKRITFNAVVEATDPKPRAALPHPQGDEFAEYAYMCRIDIVD